LTEDELILLLSREDKRKKKAGKDGRNPVWQWRVRADLKMQGEESFYPIRNRSRIVFG
jgi:hypothetical protein